MGTWQHTNREHWSIRTVQRQYCMPLQLLQPIMEAAACLGSSQQWNMALLQNRALPMTKPSSASAQNTPREGQLNGYGKEVTLAV